MGGIEREVPEHRAKKGSLSQTYKKNTEANAKVYDLNEKRMQALETLAAVYAIFEKAGERGELRG